MPLTPEQQKANERFYLKMVIAKTPFFIWKDQNELYSFSSGKMKPQTLKGYVELSATVSRPFMERFVECPDGHNKDMVWVILDSIPR